LKITLGHRLAIIGRHGEAAKGWFVYELFVGGLKGATTVQVTHLDSYLAIGSVAPDGKPILFESSPARDNRFEHLGSSCRRNAFSNHDQLLGPIRDGIAAGDRGC